MQFCIKVSGVGPLSVPQFRGLERNGHDFEPILKAKNWFKTRPYSNLAQDAS